jgi:hypothetical protein
MRLPLALFLIALPVAAQASRAEGDACAAGLPEASRQIYHGTLAGNPTPATARSIVVAQTEKLMQEGRLGMLEARSAAEAAGRCLAMIDK